ncbi:MAG: hypothetical protein VB124_03695 [Burkholderia sp.]
MKYVRAAAVAFKDRYNPEWRLEKLGFKTPLEARQAPLLPPDRKSCLNNRIRYTVQAVFLSVEPAR